MGGIERILQRRPQVDEAEMEDLRERTMARLMAALAPEPPHGPEPAADPELASDDADPATTPESIEGAPASIDTPVADVESDARELRAGWAERFLSGEASAITHHPFGPAIGVGPDHLALTEPASIAVVDHPEPITLPSDLAGTDATGVPSLWAGEPPVQRPDRPETDVPAGAVAHAVVVTDGIAVDERVQTDATNTGIETSDTEIVASAPAQPSRATPNRAPRRDRPRRRPTPTSVAPAYCPNCALILDPAPASDSTCERCRRPIIVRQLASGLVVYLTEAAIEVYETEQIREAELERRSTERRAWLGLAQQAGAPAGRAERLERGEATVEGVGAAKSFYLATIDQRVEDALRHDRWDDAARIRRDQATAIHELTGHALPLDPEIRDRLRDAAAIELRGIATMARTASLVADRCCEGCRADDGTVVRIAAELRRSRLPHEACAKELCGCRWDLAPRDVALVERYLIRAGRLRGQDAAT